jgi:hypothetical protein
VKSIVTFDGELEEAFTPQSVTLTLEDEIDISRGDMLVRPGNVPQSRKSSTRWSSGWRRAAGAGQVVLGQADDEADARHDQHAAVPGRRQHDAPQGCPTLGSTRSAAAR